MPLHIDNELVGPDNNFFPAEIFNKHISLCERSTTFRAGLDVIELTENDRILYVHQRELATISCEVNSQNFKYVCSDDATTCHIVVLKEKNSKVLSLAHFDGENTNDGLNLMFSEMFELMSILGCNNGNFDLYLVGGFIDEKCYSEKLFESLLLYCTTSPYMINLQIAYCYSLNNVLKDGRNAVDVYGIALDIQSGTFFIATCSSRGPDCLLREARMSSVETFSPVYDYKKELVYIKPFTFKKQKYTKELLALDDKTYLRCCSTSPHCEPEHFVQRSKKVLLFREKWNSLIEDIFCNERREYVLDNQNKWNVLNKKQKIFD